jgi:hypothetical protein
VSLGRARDKVVELEGGGVGVGAGRDGLYSRMLRSEDPVRM